MFQSNSDEKVFDQTFVNLSASSAVNHVSVFVCFSHKNTCYYIDVIHIPIYPQKDEHTQPHTNTHTHTHKHTQ